MRERESKVQTIVDNLSKRVEPYTAESKKEFVEAAKAEMNQLKEEIFGAELLRTLGIIIHDQSACSFEFDCFKVTFISKKRKLPPEGFSGFSLGPRVCLSVHDSLCDNLQASSTFSRKALLRFQVR